MRAFVLLLACLAVASAQFSRSSSGTRSVSITASPAAFEQTVTSGGSSGGFGSAGLSGRSFGSGSGARYNAGYQAGLAAGRAAIARGALGDRTGTPPVYLVVVRHRLAVVLPLMPVLLVLVVDLIKLELADYNPSKDLLR
ncbi:hypothetical protein pipiens_004349 [Culex pipiens pipiens]|uniref:Uncharacterized protein n=1 Tax=Culex pipiens pipiens TaxID=38569 RepID=A0ABD1CJY2_CULPP